MRKLTSCVPMILGALLLLTGLPDPGLGKDLTHAAHTTATQPNMKADLAYFKELEKRTNGQVKVTKFNWAQSLLKAPDMLDGVGRGIADVAFFCPGYYPAKLPLLSLSEMVFVVQKPGSDAYARTEVYETWEPFRREFQQHNIEVLYFHPGLATVIGLNKAIASPNDLRGLKLRAYGVLNDVLTRTGLVPVAISSAEIYTSTQLGVIDGFVGIPLMMGVANRYNEIVKTYVDPGIGVYFGCFLGMNLDVYKALPESAKQEVRKLRREWINVHVDELMTGEDEVLADIKKRGIRMLSFSPDQRAAWRKAVAPADLEEGWIAEREKAGAPAREFMQKFKALLPKYEGMSRYVDPFNRIR